MATKPFLSQIAVPVGTTTGDVYYPQTSLLMHFNGTNGSTTMTDNSKNNITATATNGASISTAQSKFGGSSVLFDGTNDYVSVTNNSAFDFGAGDFTIEYWEYRTLSSTLSPILSRHSNNYAPYLIGWYDSSVSSAIVMYMSSNGSSWDIASNVSMGVITTNVWTHYAVTRQGNTFRTFQNGIQISTFTSAATLPAGVGPLEIGRYEGTYYFKGGYIDELRITKGIARYTSNFTPSTTQFLDSTGDANSNVVVNSTATGFAIGTGGINGAQLAKAWVNFNGTGTVAIRDSYNVSSITDSGTGDYTINFSTALNNSNYSAVGSSRAVFGTRISVIGFSNYATTSVRIGTVNLTNQLQDEDTNCVTIFSN
jgi:hypothetical protein